MDKVKIPKEKMDYTIDLLITMTVEELAKELNKDNKEMLIEFLSSYTGKCLYDVENRLWWNGPSYLAEMYMSEMANKQKTVIV